MILDKTIRRMFRREERANIQNPKVPLSSPNIVSYLGGPGNASGITVNRHTAVSNPAIFNGVRIVSESIAKLPLVVYRREDGGKVRDKDHPSYPLLVHEASEIQTAFEFRRQIQADALLEGNGYGWIKRTEAMDPVSLRRLEPSATHPVLEQYLDDRGMPISSRVWYITTMIHGATANSTQTVVLPAQDVIHIKNYGEDELKGYSIVEILAEAVGMTIAHQRYSSVFFRNSAIPNMVLTLPFELKKEEDVERFRASWNNAHRGADNQHKIGVLEGGADIKIIQTDPEKSQLLESMKYDLSVVSNIIGVPGDLIGADNNTSYNSLEQQNKNFLNYSLGGRMAAWQQEARAKLLREREKQADSHVIEHVRDELERADRKTEVEADVMEVTNGLRTIDEKRARDNLPPLPDGTGSKTRQPLNIGFSETIDEPEPAQPDPAGRAHSTPLESAPLDPSPNTDELVAMRAQLRKSVCVHIDIGIRRLRRITESKAKDGAAFMAWLDDLRSNVGDFAKRLDGLDAQSTIEQYLDGLREELLEVSGTVTADDLADAVSQVMARHELESPPILAGQLLDEVNNGTT